MIKLLPILISLLLSCITLTAQERITEEPAAAVIIKFEQSDVDIVELKTMRKWKALELSHEMKSQMDYNVVRVKYRAKGTDRMVIIDMNLVPIRYDYLNLLE